jgi:uncharacterized RDD family membrane protein YckC
MDFDFKPITSGLGFHTQKTTEIRPAFNDAPIYSSHSIPASVPASTPAARTINQNQIYQNELSLFYNSETSTQAPAETARPEKVIRLATKSQRIVAYFLDMGLILSLLGIVLTIMARMVEMDLMEVWSAYPNEITPLVMTLFVGFYLMYFSIFEKTSQSTLGKNLMGIKVLNIGNKAQGFSMLLVRSFVSLMNFVSLGLFSYFDLQNKISNTKVVRVD